MIQGKARRFLSESNDTKISSSSPALPHLPDTGRYNNNISGKAEKPFHLGPLEGIDSTDAQI